mgnify:CR=1 FL=1
MRIMKEIIRYKDPSISISRDNEENQSSHQSSNQSLTIKERSWDGCYYPINVFFF